MWWLKFSSLIAPAHIILTAKISRPILELLSCATILWLLCQSFSALTCIICWWVFRWFSFLRWTSECLWCTWQLRTGLGFCQLCHLSCGHCCWRTGSTQRIGMVWDLYCYVGGIYTLPVSYSHYLAWVFTVQNYNNSGSNNFPTSRLLPYSIIEEATHSRVLWYWLTIELYFG